MVSDNDCDVAVCDIKGVGFFPTKRFWMYFVYTKSMLAYLYITSKFMILRKLFENIYSEF